MIPIPSNVRVWIAAGRTDMRRGMQSLALVVRESLKRDPDAGDLYIFRGRRGDLIKVLWHDGLSVSLYAKRLDRGKFIWPLVETVREKFSCRDCERISHAPAPFYTVARGWAGPSLLAMIMFEKFGQH